MFPFLDFEGDASRYQVVDGHANCDENDLLKVLYLHEVVKAYGLISGQIIVNLFLKLSLQISHRIFTCLFGDSMLLLRLLILCCQFRVLFVYLLFHDVKEFALKHHPFNFGKAILRGQIYALFVNDNV